MEFVKIMLLLESVKGLVSEFIKFKIKIIIRKMN